MPKKSTTADFIQKAKQKHGDRYDYSKSIYVNSRTKITIICKEHGEFLQIPPEHARGYNCRKCGIASMKKNTRLSTDEWIKQAKGIHGEKYDYSETVYTRMLEKLIIICPIHGSFSQFPQNHTQGKGCPECGKLSAIHASKETWKKKMKTTEKFIHEAKQIHGNRFDYTSTKYLGYKTKIEFKCPIHGLVSTLPHIHLQGNGCPVCGKSEGARSRTLTTGEWVQRAMKKHGNKFDYSKSKYINSLTKVHIICPIHGEFYQFPMVHLESHGCPDCGNEVGTKKNTKSLDFFIKEAREVHGDTYDYSLVNYVNGKTKVIIGCSIHGFFEIRPETHVRRGQGCGKCVGRGLSTEEWIIRFQKVHKRRYDYSSFTYKPSNHKSSIICRTHGEFLLRPSQHYRGRGCPVCSKIELAAKKSTLGAEKFKISGREKFGEKFDYSNVLYKNNKTPVKIICKLHGAFNQAPYQHIISSTGCPRCTYDIPSKSGEISSIPKRRGYSHEDWIKKASKAHDNFYDYSKVEYKKSSDMVTIICPKHGEFSQLATNHVKGIGCWKCYKDRASSLQRMSEEEVIEKCKEIHGDYYDYSKVKYINNRSKFTVICPIHGDFETSYALHYYQKCGCSGCAKHGYDLYAPGYYYVHNILNQYGDVIFIKGGISNDPDARFKRWKTAIKSLPRHKNHQPIVVHKVWFENGVEAKELEQALLNVEEIRYPNVPGMDGGTELFRIDPLIYAMEEWDYDFDFI